MWGPAASQNTVIKQRKLTGFAPPPLASLGKSNLTLQASIGEEDEEMEE